MATINYSTINKYGAYAKPNQGDFTNSTVVKGMLNPVPTNQYGQTYDSALSSYNQWSTDPEAVALRTTNAQNRYAPVVKADGTPLFDPTFYGGIATGTVKQAQVDAQLNTWADGILKNDPKINWELSGGAVDTNPAYKTAKANLLNNLATNPNLVNYNQSQADAKKAAEDKIVADAKAKADADAAALLAKTEAETKAADEAKATAEQKAADDKATLDAAAATKLANTESINAQQTAIENAYTPNTLKDLGVAVDTNGMPIVQTANITQTMVDDSLKGTPTNVKYDENGKPIITTPTYTTVDTGLLGRVTADKVTPVTVDRTGTQSAAEIAKIVDAAKSVDVNVTPDSLVSNRLSGLLAKNNPYIQQAVNSANLQASRRGMLNTGAAAGFAQDAAIKAALPIAQADAATIAKANESNAAARNALINAGLDLKSKGLISDAGNNVTLNTTQAKLDLDASQYDAANKLTADTFNAGELNKVLVSNNATLNEAQKDAFNMWGQMAQADTLSQSNTYRIAVQAQYEALKQGAADANLLNRAFVEGNIDLGVAMAKSLADAAATERKAAIDKAAASQLASDNAEAARKLAEETRITKIADAEIAKAKAKQDADIDLTLKSFEGDQKKLSEARQFMANQENDKNSFREKVSTMADVTSEAKATMINTNNLSVDARTLSTLQSWGVEAALEKSDAAKTSTALLTV
jgi:hypothetical protein